MHQRAGMVRFKIKLNYADSSLEPPPWVPDNVGGESTEISTLNMSGWITEATAHNIMRLLHGRKTDEELDDHDSAAGLSVAEEDLAEALGGEHPLTGDAVQTATAPDDGHPSDGGSYDDRFSVGGVFADHLFGGAPRPRMIVDPHFATTSPLAMTGIGQLAGFLVSGVTRVPWNDPDWEKLSLEEQKEQRQRYYSSKTPVTSDMWGGNASFHMGPGGCDAALEAWKKRLASSWWTLDSNYYKFETDEDLIAALVDNRVLSEETVNDEIVRPWLSQAIAHLRQEYAALRDRSVTPDHLEFHVGEGAFHVRDGIPLADDQIPPEETE